MQAQNQNNMAQVAKTQAKKKKKSPITRENQHKIFRAYIALYNAFLLQNLMNKKSLGAASHAALQMLAAKIATMDKSNPATKLLRKIHKRFSKKISRVIMTSRLRDAVAKMSPDMREKLTKQISKKINDANKVLNTISAQYKPKTIAKTPVANKKPQLVAAAVRVENKKPTMQKPQNQKMVLQLWLRQRQLQNERGAA